MKNIFCLFFGHHWYKINDDISVCERCQFMENKNRKPVSELDEIINDQNWYRAKAKKK